MNIIFANRPYFMSATKWLAGTLIPSSRGQNWFRVQVSGGAILSIQPAGTGFVFETRAAEADGGYEQCCISGSDLLFMPDAWCVVPFRQVAA